jgi:flagellar motor protein MotB
MTGRMQVAGIIVVLIAAVGCTPVQKGTAAGGLLGGATGATIGHFATSAGGIPGAVVGFGVGAAAGAVAADHYYGSDVDQGALAQASAEADRLSKELDSRDQALRAKDAQLLKEQAQQKAALEAYEKARSGNNAAAAATTTTTTKDGEVQVTKSGDAVTYTVLSEVLFASGRADLTAEGKKALKEAARMIHASYPGNDIEVRGHTDNVPIHYSSYKSNWDLSCARAASVVRYLAESEGFPAEKLHVTGYGDTRPVASNDTAEGRRKNRRAEIVVRLTPAQQVAQAATSGS